jgi:hypothetical protein
MPTNGNIDAAFPHIILEDPHPMPEQITKYPDVTLQVLNGAGAVCGRGAPQKILTQCPVERFCSLPSGELCIYGIDQIPQMTQIKLQELAAVVGPKADTHATGSPEISAMEAMTVTAVFVAGVVLGRFWPRVRSEKPPRHRD